MSVKVIFCKWGNDKEIADEIADEIGDCYILTPNNWDDFGYKTTFKVNIYKNGEQYGEYSRKILFQDETIIDVPSFFERILGKSRFIDLKDVFTKYKFISLGFEYEELKKIFSENDDYIEILKVLNDVIYLENKELDSPLRTELLLIKEYEAFEISLTREQYSKKMLQEGKALLFGETLNENRFNFEFNFQLNEKNYKYKFDFNKKEDLPHRINVLIGKNGSGKSQTLLALSEYLLNNKKFRSRVAKELHPNFLYHLLLFAYNPHEKFIISRDFKKYDIEYKYVGYRRYKSIIDIEQKLLMESPNLCKLFVNFKDDDIRELSEKILKADIEDERNKNDEEKDELINSSFESNPNKEELSKIFKDNWKILIDTITQDMMDKNILDETLYKSFNEIYKKYQVIYVHIVE